jgi:hypothetical protein
MLPISQHGDLESSPHALKPRTEKTLKRREAVDYIQGCNRQSTGLAVSVEVTGVIPDHWYMRTQGTRMVTGTKRAFSVFDFGEKLQLERCFGARCQLRKLLLNLT